jgi:cardiolipin synthase
MSVQNVVFSLPNLISLGRLFSVPVTVWLILSDAMLIAFWLFVAACVSDAVDGFLAKRFHAETRIGGFLDPIADKALLVSVFITLGQAAHLATWLVILVVFRDLLILVGAYLFHLLTQKLSVQPLWISKVNTAVQFALAATVLGFSGFEIDQRLVVEALVYLTAATTIASGGVYVVKWSRYAMAMERAN